MEVDKKEPEVRMINLIEPPACKRACLVLTACRILEKPIIFLNEFIREVHHLRTKSWRVDVNLSRAPALIG